MTDSDTRANDAAAPGGVSLKWATACIAGGAAVGLLVFVLSTPVYRAEAKVLPTDHTYGQSQDLGALGSLAGIVGVGVGGAESARYEAIEIMRSKSFLQSFINDNKLLPVQRRG